MWQMTKQTVVALAYFPVKVFYTGYNLVTGKAERCLRADVDRWRESSSGGDRLNKPD
jgi:hypothetical protein